ncbi:MAG: alpha/beta hydrolase [Chitinophagaceae bacterium]
MDSETEIGGVTGSTNGYAPVNGIRMYYEIHGKGTPLVLIHGGGSTIQSSFGNILSLLAKNHQVIAVELQAHGHTSDREGPETFQQDADDVAALVAYLTIGSAHFLGFSNGGNTALQIGIRHPLIVKKLVAVSAVYKREGLIPGFFGWMENASLENMPMPLQTAFLTIPGNDQAGLQNMHDKDAARMVHFEDWPKTDLAAVTAPTLLINADYDVVLNQHVVEMAGIIPNARLLILPGIHGSCLGEICTTKPGSCQPAITAMAVTEFLND